MAKKKRKASKKKQETKSVNYSAELIGLLFILLGILGIGFGVVGLYLKKISMFVIGEFWLCLPIFMVILGFYMIIRRQLPKIFSLRKIGCYLLVLSVLVLSHYSYIKNYSYGEIINQTITNYQERISTMSVDSSILSTGQSSIKIGGGIIGAAGASLFSNLFGSLGSIIVLVAVILISCILIFSFDLGELILKVRNDLKPSEEENNDEDENDEKEDEPEEEKPKKEKVSLFDKLKKHKEETEEEEDEVKVQVPVSVVEEIKTEAMPQVNNSVVSSYHLPSIDLLDKVTASRNNNVDFTKSNKIIIERVLNDFEIKGTIVEIHIGPAVTQYEVAVPSGTKLSKIASIDKELAAALAAKSVAIEAPIPGKSTVGIEVPNPSISAVKFREVMGFLPAGSEKMKILVSLGKDLMGKVQVADIKDMPHLLVAGSTGSGKSVCINSFICSILMRRRPDEVKLVLVDPKKVEFSDYNGIPHLLCPVINDPKAASVALQKIVAEMDDRYEKFSAAGVKKIEQYNEYLLKNDQNAKKMPYIVVIIDELADLMLVAAKDVEASIQRITQLARAAGIHLIVATQRPSTNVITGVIKANIPSRIAFAVASNVDSRTILDKAGAEKLLGRGDMLYLPMGENTPRRIQGCFVDDSEIARIIECVKEQQGALYDENFSHMETESNQNSEFGGIGTGGGGTDDDPLYNEIYEYAVSVGKISASLIQRKFKLGYNRAARIIDILEERGVIGPQNGSKPREVLIGRENNDEE